MWWLEFFRHGAIFNCITISIKFKLAMYFRPQTKILAIRKTKFSCICSRIDMQADCPDMSRRRDIAHSMRNSRFSGGSQNVRVHKNALRELSRKNRKCMFLLIKVCISDYNQFLPNYISSKFYKDSKYISIIF